MVLECLCTYSRPTPVCVCVCKNTPRLTYLLQNARSRISLSSIWRRQKDGESSHGEKARKQIKRRNCQAVCSHLSRLERVRRQSLVDAWEDLKRGTKSREGEEEEERKRKRADLRAAPKGTLAFEAEALEQAVALTS